MLLEMTMTYQWHDVSVSPTGMIFMTCGQFWVEPVELWSIQPSRGKTIVSVHLEYVYSHCLSENEIENASFLTLAYACTSQKMGNKSRSIKP